VAGVAATLEGSITWILRFIVTKDADEFDASIHVGRGAEICFLTASAGFEVAAPAAALEE